MSGRGSILVVDDEPTIADATVPARCAAPGRSDPTSSCST